VTSITFPKLQFLYISETVGLNFTDFVYNCVADDKSDLVVARHLTFSQLQANILECDAM